MVVLVHRLHHQVLDHRSGFQATVIGHHALDHVVHDHHHGENGCSTGTPLFSARALEPIQSSRACWQQISFDLHKGDRLGLVAPSGAGKTLLLRALAQLDPLRSGELCCRGASPGGKERFQRIMSGEEDLMSQGTKEEEAIEDQEEEKEEAVEVHQLKSEKESVRHHNAQEISSTHDVSSLKHHRNYQARLEQRVNNLRSALDVARGREQASAVRLRNTRRRDVYQFSSKLY